MPLPPELPPLLACPRCRGPLEYREMENHIRCAACGVVYPIPDGIPVLLPESASPR